MKGATRWGGVIRATLWTATSLLTLALLATLALGYEVTVVAPEDTRFLLFPAVCNRTGTLGEGTETVETYRCGTFSSTVHTWYWSPRRLGSFRPKRFNSWNVGFP